MLFTPPGPPVLPVVSQLHVSPTAFRVGPPATAGISRVRSAAPQGATVTFTLDVAGGVLARVESETPGRLKGARCYSSRKHGKRCTIIKRLVGTVHLKGVQGANTVPFSGRIAGAALKPGKYLMQITPYSGATKGTPATAPFTIVR
jgi:hypothetical protein